MSSCVATLPLDEVFVHPMEEAWAAENAKHLQDAEQVVSDWSSEPEMDFALDHSTAPQAPSEAALDCLRSLNGARSADEMKSRVVDFVMARMPPDALVRSGASTHAQKNTAIVSQSVVQFMETELLPALPPHAHLPAWTELRASVHALTVAATTPVGRMERAQLQGKVRSAYARHFQRLLRRFLDDGAALATVWRVLGRESETRIEAVARERRPQLLELVANLDALAGMRSLSRGSGEAEANSSSAKKRARPAVSDAASAPDLKEEEEDVQLPDTKRSRASVCPDFDALEWAAEFDAPGHEHAAHTLLHVLGDMNMALSASHESALAVPDLSWPAVPPSAPSPVLPADAAPSHASSSSSSAANAWPAPPAAVVVSEPSACVFKSCSGSRSLAACGAAFEISGLAQRSRLPTVLDVLSESDEVLQSFRGTVAPTCSFAAASLSSSSPASSSSIIEATGADAWALSSDPGEETLQQLPGASLRVLDQARASWTWGGDGVRVFVTAQADKSARFGRGSAAFTLRLRVGGVAEAVTAPVAMRSKTNHEWLSQGRRREALQQLGARYVAALEAQREVFVRRGGSHAQTQAALARDALVDLKSKVDAIAHAM